LISPSQTQSLLTIPEAIVHGLVILPESLLYVQSYFRMRSPFFLPVPDAAAHGPVAAIHVPPAQGRYYRWPDHGQAVSARVPGVRRSSTMTTIRLTTEQAAERFGVSARTIRRWVRHGRLAAERIRGALLITVEVDDDGHRRPESGRECPDGGHDGPSSDMAAMVTASRTMAYHLGRLESENATLRRRRIVGRAAGLAGWIAAGLAGAVAVITHLHLQDMHLQAQIAEHRVGLRDDRLADAQAQLATARCEALDQSARIESMQDTLDAVRDDHLAAVRQIRQLAADLAAVRIATAASQPATSQPRRASVARLQAGSSIR